MEWWPLMFAKHGLWAERLDFWTQPLHSALCKTSGIGFVIPVCFPLLSSKSSHLSNSSISLCSPSCLYCLQFIMNSDEEQIYNDWGSTQSCDWTHLALKCLGNATS